MELVPRSVLADLLSGADGALDSHAETDLCRALAAVGYPPDTLEVTAADAVAVLEWLDRGVIGTTRRERMKTSGGFRNPGSSPSRGRVSDRG
jgi:hypothetical protein